MADQHLLSLHLGGNARLTFWKLDAEATTFQVDVQKDYAEPVAFAATAGALRSMARQILLLVPEPTAERAPACLQCCGSGVMDGVVCTRCGGRPA